MSLSELTKDFVASQYRDLVEELPLRQISVTTIAKACGINRKTFYYHFADTFDLKLWIFRSGLDRELRKHFSENELVFDTEMREEKYRDLAFYVDRRNQSSPQEMGDFWYILSNYMYSTPSYYKNVLIHDEQDNSSLTQYILKTYYLQIRKDVLSNLTSLSLPNEDVNFLASYFTNACVGWIINSVKSFLPGYFPIGPPECNLNFANITHTLIKLITRRNTLSRMQGSLTLTDK